jgi:hypothetical protein
MVFCEFITFRIYYFSNMFFPSQEKKHMPTEGRVPNEAMTRPPKQPKTTYNTTWSHHSDLQIAPTHTPTPRPRIRQADDPATQATLDDILQGKHRSRRSGFHADPKTAHVAARPKWIGASVLSVLSLDQFASTHSTSIKNHNITC